MTDDMMSLRTLLEKSADADLLRDGGVCRAAPDGAGGRADHTDREANGMPHCMTKWRVLSPSAQLIVDPAGRPRHIRDTCADGAYRFHWSIIPSEKSLPIAAAHRSAYTGPVDRRGSSPCLCRGFPPTNRSNSA